MADRPAWRTETAGSRRWTWLVAALAALVGAGAGWWLKPDPAAPVPSTPVLDFGEVRQRATSDALSVELSNVGERALAVTWVAVTGDAGGDFAIEADGCGGRRLAAGERCALEVVFRPGGRPSPSRRFASSSSPGSSAPPATPRKSL